MHKIIGNEVDEARDGVCRVRGDLECRLEGRGYGEGEDRRMRRLPHVGISFAQELRSDPISGDSGRQPVAVAVAVTVIVAASPNLSRPHPCLVKEYYWTFHWTLHRSRNLKKYVNK